MSNIMSAIAFALYMQLQNFVHSFNKIINDMWYMPAQHQSETPPFALKTVLKTYVFKQNVDC